MSSATHGIFFLSMDRNMRADTAEAQPLLQRNSEGSGAGGSTWSSTWALVFHTWTWFLQPLQPHCVIQFRSVTQLCLTLGDPRDCSTPGFPGHHQLLGLAQAHVHQVGDAIQPCHPLLSPSPPAFNLSQHQDLLQ